jgi:homocysteine S-methyltransferase
VRGARLPQLDEDLFLTDAGLDLRCFAAFPLLATEDGRTALRNYFRPFLRLAQEELTGFILDTVTWRANADWGARLGYDAAALDRVNRQAVDFARELAGAFASPTTPIVFNGVVGPRGDAYRPDTMMTADEAQHYHDAQVATFSNTDAGMITALTLTYGEEAIGIARAARAHQIPLVVSFTVETDGRLPSGVTLQSAVETVDHATDASPAYYMINCAHPHHLAGIFSDEGSWRERLRGLRANASTKSHAELDESTELDAGDPLQLAADYKDLQTTLPRLNVLGGCCGTDYRHVEAIATAWVRT